MTIKQCDDLDRLQERLVGNWSNRLQAFGQPHEFAHVVLEIEELSRYKLLLRQSYNRADKPYRERILELRKGKKKNEFVIYTSIPGETNKEQRKNCAYHILWYEQQDLFEGSISPDQKCVGCLNDKEYLLSADLTITADTIYTRDQGLDLKTQLHVWGQRTNAFRFERLQTTATPKGLNEATD